MRFLLFLISLFTISIAYSSELFLKHLDTGNGLSNNKINSIYRDSEGYIWIGTSSGLCRYDGYSFKIYHPDVSETGNVNSNNIEEIQEDANGSLWIRTSGGYLLYDPDRDMLATTVTDRLREYGLNSTPSLVYIDSDKGMWIYISGDGIYYMDGDGAEERGQRGEREGKVYGKGTEKVRKVYGKQAEKIDEQLFGNTVITDLIETPYGIVAIDDKGTLSLIDHETKRIVTTENHIANQLLTNRPVTFSLMFDRDNLLWIYSYEQLWLYDLTDHKWLSDLLPHHGKNLTIKTLHQGNNGKIWIGRDHHGLEQVVKGSEGIRFEPVADNSDKEVNNTVITIYDDPSSTLWIGTYKKGVFYHNQSAHKFSLFSLPDVNCITVGSDGTEWIGTDAAGLLSRDPSTGSIKHYPDPADYDNPPALTSLLETPIGDLYIGSYSRGLKRLHNNKFEHIKTGTRLDSTYTWSLALSDNGNNIWIGTLGAGVFNYNPVTSVIKEYNLNNSGLTSDYVTSIAVGANCVVYFGTAYGVNSYNPTTQKISLLDNVYENNIIDICYDSRGLLWIATAETLQVYDPNRNRVHTINTHQNDTPSLILGIQEDKMNNMWVSEGSRLIHITPDFDSKTGDFNVTMQSYGTEDGLQNSDFNQRSFAILPSGDILVGGLYGINHFNPTNITFNRTLPKVIFSNLHIGNKEVRPGEKIDGHVIINTALNRCRKIDLWHGNSDFSIDLATDNHVLPEKNSYRYKLEGFNEEWNSTQHNQITYTNLPTGKYRLLVTAYNNDKYQSIEPAVVEITVHPPFWLSIWAKILYSILFILAVYLVYRLIQRHERRKFNEKRKEVARLKQEELNQMKFKFFTNVSHDLRTPLTLIISPLEAMIKETNDASKLKTLTVMRNNALRLLNMVNQLLDFRKNEVTGLTLHPTHGDVAAFIRNVCQSFVSLSERNNISFNFSSSVESLQMRFDEDKLSKIIMNLLGNAFKYTPEGGQVDVNLKVEGSTFLISVADTGPGIKDENKQKIFERFFQVDDSTVYNAMGNGIGLSLVKEYISLHNGDIKVIDNSVRGSIFIVSLPIVQDKKIDTTPVQQASETKILLSADSEKPVKQPIKKDKNDQKPIALVVDDSTEMLDFLKDGLQNDFHVMTALNGKEALNTISTLRPSIILTDIMMPEMDGVELCRQLKAKPEFSPIPIIILTAKQDTSDKVEGLTIGADDYVTKPFDLQLLILRMKRLIQLTKRGVSRTLIDPEPDDITITPYDEQLVEKAVKYVVSNIKRSDLSVDELSSHLCMSRVHLYKKLKAITGKTPIEFIRILRLKRGAQMLRESQLNVSEIAYQVGFNAPKNFSKYFKEEFGILPSDYQQREEHITNRTL
ncbi:MAG: response regulator [Duncaniella sp.]|nr:response regulator [Duncaniella sp.]